MSKRKYRLLAAAVVTIGFILVMWTFWPTNVGDVPPKPTSHNEVSVLPNESSQPASGSTTESHTEPNINPSAPNYGGIPSVSEYDGVHAWVQINNGEPYFTQDERTNTKAFELYADLDNLGRCGTAYANICQEIMPTEPRGSIGSVKPTGWQSTKYKGVVDGDYLYNRCHLIGFQLAGENANPKNLITGTRYLNIKGMLDAENMVTDYVKETNNHVLYRVTPIFNGDNLVADGVLMEAYSVEDEGDGISFCIFAFNVQPGIVINYADGTSHANTEQVQQNTTERHYILNTNSHKFHLPDCDSAAKTSEKNKADYYGTREELIEQGYTPCGFCNP